MKKQTTLAVTMASAGALALLPSAHAQTVDESTNRWATSINVGGTLSRGNAITTLVSGGIETQRKYTSDQFDLGVSGLYGESKLPSQSSETETADQLKAFGQYNHEFTSLVYGFAHVEGLHDGISDIQYRLSLSVGAGFYAIKTDKLSLAFEAGPGFLAEKLGANYESYVTLRFAERFNWQITKRSKFWESAEYLPQVDKWGNYIVNVEVGAEAALNDSGNLNLRAVAQDNYNSIPAAGRLKNDIKLIVGVAYKF